MAERVDHDQLPMITPDDYKRIGAILNEIGGPNVVWGSQAHLDVWMTEHQIRCERLTNAQLSRATWALFGATVALVVATVVLVLVTFVVAS